MCDEYKWAIFLGFAPKLVLWTKDSFEEGDYYGYRVIYLSAQGPFVRYVGQQSTRMLKHCSL